MAGLFLISSYNSHSLTLPLTPPNFHHHRRRPASLRPDSPPARFPIPGGDALACRRRARGVSVVTRGVPTANSYILAFVLPLSLIVITVFTALKVGDKLDKDYLEEVALDEAIRKAMEEGGDDDEDDYEDDDGYEEEEIESPLEEAATPRTRINRPIREI